MFLIFLLLWIIFNGRFTLEVVLLGVFISLLLTIFVNKFFYKEKRNTKHFVRNGFLLVEYLGILIVEIIKANIAVFTIALKKEIEIEPCICHFTTTIKEPIHRILLANSITLTPGTITVNLDDKGNYTVHCLTKEFSEGINDSIFVKMLLKMEED